jgi:hypothetical protein
MAIIFEQGDMNKPKGHGLIYFTIGTEPGKIYSSYIVILPIKTDLSKYVPPFLASTIGDMPLDNFSAFAMPPVPEDSMNITQLSDLATFRDDDLLNGGDIFSYDVTRLMEAVNNSVTEYTNLYTSNNSQVVTSSSVSEALELEDTSDNLINDVLFGLMSEKDKLTEVAKLLSKLRFSHENDDQIVTSQTKQELEMLAKHFPENFKLPRLLKAAYCMNPNSLQIASLYLDRCYKMSEGDYLRVKTLDEQINQLDK